MLAELLDSNKGIVKTKKESKSIFRYFADMDRVVPPCSVEKLRKRLLLKAWNSQCHACNASKSSQGVID